MSTKLRNAITITTKALCIFMICYFIQLLLTSDRNQQLNQKQSANDTKSMSFENSQDSGFMSYLQDLPDSGVTKVIYKYMNNIDISSSNEISNNNFIYAYSLITETPCIGIETVIQEDIYKASAVKVEVHTLHKVKSSIIDDEEEIIPTPTSTPIPTPTPLQKIYENEDLSAETQHDAVYLAENYDVPVEILLGIAYKETRYTAGIVSADNHDYGFCQIRDINHNWLEQEIGRELDFLNSEYDSMEAACFMLRDLKTKYNTSSWGFVLLCYNGGEEYANRLASQGIWGSSYTQEVLAKAYELGWNGE